MNLPLPGTNLYSEKEILAFSGHFARVQQFINIGWSMIFTISS